MAYTMCFIHNYSDYKILLVRQHTQLLHRPFPIRDSGEVNTTQHSPFSIFALAALSSPIDPAEIPRAGKKLV